MSSFSCHAFRGHSSASVCCARVSVRDVVIDSPATLVPPVWVKQNARPQILDSALVRVEEIGPSNVAYAAPEVFAGDIGCAVDIFAFGVLLLGNCVARN